MAASIHTLPVHQLQCDDAIHFGNDLVKVVGVDAADPYLDGATAVLVTEDISGAQFCDYLDPQRTFTVIRYTA